MYYVIMDRESDNGLSYFAVRGRAIAREDYGVPGAFKTTLIRHETLIVAILQTEKFEPESRHASPYYRRTVTYEPAVSFDWWCQDGTNHVRVARTKNEQIYGRDFFQEAYITDLNARQLLDVSTRGYEFDALDEPLTYIDDNGVEYDIYNAIVAVI